MKYLTAISILLLSHGLYAGGHDDSEPSFEGLISSEIFDLDGKISVEEAIKVGTINGAYASYEEDIKGSLEIGKLADLVILEKDPRKTDPMSIIDIPIQRTMVGGNWSYES